MKVFNLLVGLVFGIIAALVGVLVHAGVFGIPFLGFILASLLVLVGAWVAWEVDRRFAVIGYVLAIALVTVWLLLYTPSDDVLALNTDKISRFWLICSVVFSLLPAIAFSVKRKFTKKVVVPAVELDMEEVVGELVD